MIVHPVPAQTQNVKITVQNVMNVINVPIVTNVITVLNVKIVHQKEYVVNQTKSVINVITVPIVTPVMMYAKIVKPQVANHAVNVNIVRIPNVRKNVK